MASLDELLAPLRAARDAMLEQAEAAARRGRLLAEAIVAVEVAFDTDAPPVTTKPREVKPKTADGPSEKFAERARASRPAPAPPRPRTSHKARSWDYEAVARVANDARERGEPMRNAVMREFDCKGPSADMAISTARKKGHEIAKGDPTAGGRVRQQKPPTAPAAFTLDDAREAIAS